MNRTPSTLVLLALLASAPLVRGAEGSGAIYTWTDRNGVIHFGDAPPAPAAPTDPAATPPPDLTDDTTVPMTLNELFDGTDPGNPPDGAQPNTSGHPGIAPDAPAAGLATPPRPYQPGSGELPDAGAASDFQPIQPGGPGGDAPTVEELDALDPVWFRTSGQGAESEVYVDENGPFTIGPPLDDQRAPPAERCAAARRDLEILRDAWPVYHDQNGRLRFQWERDPYRGARRYLDEASRQTALAGVRQTLERDCATPEDPTAQAAARAQLMQAALCEAERTELEAMETLGGTNPVQSLEDKRTLVHAVCRDPDPPQTSASTTLAPPESVGAVPSSEAR